MDGSITATATFDGVSGGTRPRQGGRFYLALAVAMLLLNLIGFAQTYFLKALFDTPELPPRTHFHGALFIAWFILFFVQTALARRGSVALHRRLGVAGATLAAVMTISGSMMIYVRALEVREGKSLIGTATVVWGNLALLAAFSSFVTLGIVYRRRREAHRRLMLLASMSMMLQAMGRIGKIPLLPGSEVLWALGGLSGLLLALVVHDLLRIRRLHSVTCWGGPLLFAFILFFSLVVPRTGLGRALIVALAS